ncbi:hypothetical protein RB195_011542 [Necator americanus]|uniref:Uncharacterized protein n=1 Tax=Necator americanus TaxID=51031 RepID=A0ABR1D4X8_NECAM
MASFHPALTGDEKNQGICGGRLVVCVRTADASKPPTGDHAVHLSEIHKSVPDLSASTDNHRELNMIALILVIYISDPIFL